VEILFKELKSKYALDVVPMSDPQIVKAFIWIAILTPLISRKSIQLCAGSILRRRWYDSSSLDGA